MSIQIISPGGLWRQLILAGSAIWTVAGCQSSTSSHEAMDNKAIVSKAFEQWGQGQGSFFDLLADDATWTITGNSPVSKEYKSKKQFLDEVINPLNEKLSKKIVPLLRGLYAEGDMVIALWDGTSTAKDGDPYFNTYAWFMRMENGKIIDVVAFFDTIMFTALWKRL